MSFLVKIDVLATQSAEINKILSKSGVDKELYKDRNDHHCTLMFASKYKSTNNFVRPFNLTACGLDVKRFGSDAIVCTLFDDEGRLEDEHKRIAKEYGTIHDYGTFNPHVTIAYGTKLTDADLLKLTDCFRGFLFVFDKEKAKMFIDNKYPRSLYYYLVIVSVVSCSFLIKKRQKSLLAINNCLLVLWIKMKIFLKPIHRHFCTSFFKILIRDFT